MKELFYDILSSRQLIIVDSAQENGISVFLNRQNRSLKLQILCELLTSCKIRSAFLALACKSCKLAELPPVVLIKIQRKTGDQKDSSPREC